MSFRLTCLLAIVYRLTFIYGKTKLHISGLIMARRDASDQAACSDNANGITMTIVFLAGMHRQC
jgi:hypothetical protein